MTPPPLDGTPTTPPLHDTRTPPPTTPTPPPDAPDAPASASPGAPPPADTVPPAADPALLEPAADAENQLLKDEEPPAELMLHHVNAQIELVEHTPDPAAVAPEDAADWVPDGEHELKRVKVYELIASRWVDQGTAFCFGQFQEETGEALLIARAERNYNDIILSTAIRSSDVYQRQQDTLIVWTEPDGVDYALSFQDPEGCSEVWNFILEVQRHMNSGGEVPTEVSSSPLLGTDTSVTTASIIRSGHLPQPQLGIIGEIERAIKSLARTQPVKERICEYIQQEDYIKSLIEVMNTAEDLESLENLHALCSLMQTILTMNDHNMFEHILDDDVFFGVLGMLEYDPDFPGHKANYREFLHNNAAFHQPIPLDAAIQRKIHHIYRLQFLKDVVLARAVDDATINVLTSCIMFNQLDVIGYVQLDPTFLRDVVGLFVDEEMLNGGKKAQQQLQQQGQGGQHQPPVVISLNGEGDNTTPAAAGTLPAAGKQPEPNGTDMDVDSKPSSTSPSSSSSSSASPKPLNGTPIPTPTPNGRLPPSKPAAHTKHYAFAPPDDLPESGIAHRRTVVQLIQQLCVMGKGNQLPARLALFRTLVDRGILFAVQWALGLPERVPENLSMINAAGEVLACLLEHDLNGVRGHVLKQVVAIEKERELGKRGAERAETVLEMMCRIMASSREMAVQSQVGDALKVWMEVPLEPSQASMGEHAPPRLQPQRKDDPGTERYMDYFYKDCVNILFKPLAELMEWRDVKDPILKLSREDTNRFLYLCDLLHNFIQQHHFRSHFYVISSNIIPRIASLLKAKDKHLRHAAFRIFRVLQKQKNPNSLGQMMKHDVMRPILDLTLQESRRDNLLSCSCQEFFEMMRRDNMKEMIKFCMTKHEPAIRKLAQLRPSGQRFELFIKRYEMNNEPPPPTEEEVKLPEKREPSSWLRNAEEDDYFNRDDDESEVIPSISHQYTRGSGASSPMPMNLGMKRKRRAAVGAASKGYRPQQPRPPSPALGSLVDYDEDEDDSNVPQKSSSPSPAPSPEQLSKIATSLSELPPSSSKILHRLLSIPTVLLPNNLEEILPKRPTKDEPDEDDKLLDKLIRSRSRGQSPGPTSSPVPTAQSLGSMRPSEKRRRSEEDDEDELLERLSKSKKVDLGAQKTAASVGKTENGDDPPKKMKLKLGANIMSIMSSSQSPTPAPGSSETGVKDGDTG